MRNKNDSSISTSTIAIAVTLLLAFLSAAYVVLSRLNAIDAKNDVRAAEISGRLNVIEGFLREKLPQFRNFASARKEALSRFGKEVAQFLPAGARQTVGTLELKGAHLIAVDDVENQTASFRVPPGATVQLWIPTLRRVRQLSGLVDIPLGTPVVVVTSPSGEVQTVIIAPPPPSAAQGQ